MSKKGRASSRGGDPDENLRGKLRESKKQVVSLLRYVRYLEKQLGSKPTYQDVPVEEAKGRDNDKVARCSNCGSDEISWINMFQVDKPIRVKICGGCASRTIVKE